MAKGLPQPPDYYTANMRAGYFRAQKARLRREKRKLILRFLWRMMGLRRRS